MYLCSSCGYLNESILAVAIHTRTCSESAFVFDWTNQECLDLTEDDIWAIEHFMEEQHTREFIERHDPRSQDRPFTVRLEASRQELRQRAEQIQRSEETQPTTSSERIEPTPPPVYKSEWAEEFERKLLARNKRKLESSQESSSQASTASSSAARSSSAYTQQAKRQALKDSKQTPGHKADVGFGESDNDQQQQQQQESYEPKSSKAAKEESQEELRRRASIRVPETPESITSRREHTRHSILLGQLEPIVVPDTPVSASSQSTQQPTTSRVGPTTSTDIYYTATSSSGEEETEHEVEIRRHEFPRTITITETPTTSYTQQVRTREPKRHEPSTSSSSSEAEQEAQQHKTRHIYKKKK